MPIDPQTLLEEAKCYACFGQISIAEAIRLALLSRIAEGGGAGGSQTPWTSDINGGGFDLSNVDNISATTFTGALTGASSLNVLKAGDTMTGALLFTDNTVDIGATGATRPRAGYFGTELQVQRSGFGATPANGLSLINSTAAAAGAQQSSSSLRFAGQGWKTDAGGASQLVESRISLLPVQGTANPSASLIFEAAVNGGAFANLFTATTGNFITAGQIVSSGAIVAASSSLISLNGRGAIGSTVAGTLVLYSNTSAADFGRLNFGGGTSAFPAIKRSTTTLQVRLADDSAYTDLEARILRVATAFTVATLPAAGTAGRISYVTDALAPAFLTIVVGGGAVITTVFDNGTNWVAV